MGVNRELMSQYAATFAKFKFVHVEQAVSISWYGRGCFCPEMPNKWIGMYVILTTDDRDYTPL